MKDKIMKVIPVLVIIIVIICIVIINNNKNKLYEELTNYVLDNEEELEKIAKEAIEGKKVDLPKYITSITVHSPKEVYVKNDNTIVQFEYRKKKEKGNKSYGFYYSEKDKVAAYQNEDYELLEIGNSRWMWSDKDNNNGITGKIKNNWYYYKVTY